jgi:hypothetical protein
LLIPVIKLSRIFFKKLAQDGLHTITLKSFSDMNSYQLASLTNSAGVIECNFMSMIKFVATYDDNHDEPDTPESIEYIQVY